MRLWSIHPKYLDTKGLVALWRESLLAQKVLMGKTKGYKNHPQLERFKQHPNPLGAIAEYLRIVNKEACKRGYCFDSSKINKRKTTKKIPVTKGQLDYEFIFLKKKLEKRDKNKRKELESIQVIIPHSLLKISTLREKFFQGLIPRPLGRNFQDLKCVIYVAIP